MNVLFPVFAMLALTLGVGARLAVSRHRAVYRGAVDARYYTAYQGEEPAPLRILSRHFSNLMEMPPLFYVACIMAFVTDQQGPWVIGLAWAYVALRFLHTAVHLGANTVILRFRVFALSVLVLATLLGVLLVGML